MQKSIVREKIRQGKPIAMAKTLFMAPAFVEMVGCMGYDCMWLCNEHLGCNPEHMEHLIRACRASGMDSLVRTGAESHDDFIRYLEMGATGLMIPHVKTADQARDLVSKVKFPPLGRRGLDGVNADADFGLLPMKDYLRVANEETFLMLQIEDVEAMEHAEEIATIPGVDIVFVGAGDLSLAMGIPGQIHDPRIIDLAARIARAGRPHGTICGIPSRTPDMTRKLLDMGIGLIAGYISEYNILRAGLEDKRAQLKDLGFEFRPEKFYRQQPA